VPSRSWAATPARPTAALTGSTFATFWLTDEINQTLQLAATSDEEIASQIVVRLLPYSQGAAVWVAQHRQLLNIDDVFADGRSQNLDWWERTGLKSSFTVPVLHGSNLVAVLAQRSRADPPQRSRRRDVGELPGSGCFRHPQRLALPHRAPQPGAAPANH
jgi:GAF domain-containing protein